MVANSQLPESVASLITQMIASQELIARQLAEQQTQLRMLMTSLLPSVIQSKPPQKLPQVTREKTVDQRVSLVRFPPLVHDHPPPLLSQKQTPSSTSAKQNKAAHPNTRKHINKVPIFKVGNMAQLHSHRIAKLGEEATQQMEIDKASKKRARLENEDAAAIEEPRSAGLRPRDDSTKIQLRESNSSTPTSPLTK